MPTWFAETIWTLLLFWCTVALKVPQVHESKQYEFLKAIQPIYQNYLIKVAVQLRTGIDFYENVISVFFFPQVSVIEKFKQCLYKLKA